MGETMRTRREAMKGSIARLAFLWVVVVFSCPVGEATAGDVAIVVSNDNATDELSFKELVKVFRQERQYWQGGARIYLIMREAGTQEKQMVLERIYKMEDQDLKKFWLGKLYRGEIASFPQTLSSNEAIKRFVRQAPNAIGFIDAASVDDRVKVLRIDGKLPGEGGYALGESSL